VSAIRAAQLIYTRVEPAYSAQGRGGYQTVYRTPSLPQASVNAIEQKVQCFRPSQLGATRLQFFILPGGDIALAHTGLIDSDPIIVDKDARPGVFLAHCLVINRAQFAVARDDPFAIVDSSRFVENPVEMLNRFGKATGVAPETTLEVSPTVSLPSRWEAVEARKLVALAMQAQESMAKGQTVLLIGTQPEITEALKTVFYLTPSHQRLACTFDTWIEGCPYQKAAFWAAGSSTWVDIGRITEVNAGARRITGHVADDLDSSDLYLTWLLRNTASGRLDPILLRAQVYQDLAEAFNARREPSTQALDIGVCRELLIYHERTLAERIDVGIAHWVGKDQILPLRARLWRTLTPQEIVKYAALERIDPAELSICATDWLLADRPDLADTDRRAIQALARSAKDERLLYLVAQLAKKPEVQVREEALRRIDAAQFQHLLDLAPDPIAPAFLVVQGRPDLADLLTESPRLDAMNAPQLAELVSALCAAGFGQRLEALAKFLPNAESDQVTQIEKRIAKESMAAPTFVEALVVRRQELGSSVNVFGRLKALVPKSGGKP
jgi:PAS domain-containing protein